MRGERYTFIGYRRRTNLGNPPAHATIAENELNTSLTYDRLEDEATPATDAITLTSPSQSQRTLLTTACERSIQGPPFQGCTASIPSAPPPRHHSAPDMSSSAPLLGRVPGEQLDVDYDEICSDTVSNVEDSVLEESITAGTPGLTNNISGTQTNTSAPLHHEQHPCTFEQHPYTSEQHPYTTEQHPYTSEHHPCPSETTFLALRTQWQYNTMPARLPNPPAPFIQPTPVEQEDDYDEVASDSSSSPATPLPAPSLAPSLCGPPSTFPPLASLYPSRTDFEEDYDEIVPGCNPTTPVQGHIPQPSVVFSSYPHSKGIEPWSGSWSILLKAPQPPQQPHSQQLYIPVEECASKHVAMSTQPRGSPVSLSPSNSNHVATLTNLAPGSPQEGTQMHTIRSAVDSDSDIDYDHLT
eukprot:Em0011g710a